MFSKQELQVVTKTLMHRRDWLVKTLESSAQSETQNSNQQTLQLIESALRKLGALEQPDAPPRQATKASGISNREQLEPEKIRVLLVDDDPAITTLLSTYLMEFGIQKISIAEDGLRAITMLYDAKPVYDMVLCDWNMPIKDGLDVHTAMRATERYQDTVFMLVTAITEAKQIRAAIEDGVNDYVVKPIDPQALTKKISRFFPRVG